MQDSDFENLTLLSNCESREKLRAIFDDCYKVKDIFLMASPKTWPRSLVKVPKDLSISNEQGFEVINSVIKLIDAVLYPKDKDFKGFWPEDFDKQMKSLLKKILGELISEWKVDSEHNQIGLPKLVDTDWKIDMMLGSSELQRMKVPSIFFNFAVKEENSLETKNVNVEMSKPELNTLFSNLSQIKDQLENLTS
mmetsp:Transcript_28983/g.33152  ORF Transcript_28983/g.33152 Transcript_28983/m.33152 type:complete len:194 (+) Transcript_28983:46-627(+)